MRLVAVRSGGAVVKRMRIAEVEMASTAGGSARMGASGLAVIQWRGKPSLGGQRDQLLQRAAGLRRVLGAIVATGERELVFVQDCEAAVRVHEEVERKVDVADSVRVEVGRR